MQWIRRVLVCAVLVLAVLPVPAAVAQVPAQAPVAGGASVSVTLVTRDVVHL